MSWLQKTCGLPDESLSKLREMYNEIIDEYAVGDYELFLIKFSYEGIVLYQLAIQRRGRDFTDIGQQSEAQEMPSDLIREWSNLEHIKNKISEWKNKYGNLVVKSHNPGKDRKYMNILQWMGFSPSVQEIRGYPAMVI